MKAAMRDETWSAQNSRSEHLPGRYTEGSRQSSHKTRRRHCSRPPPAAHGRAPLMGERGAVGLWMSVRALLYGTKCT